MSKPHGEVVGLAIFLYTKLGLITWPLTVLIALMTAYSCYGNVVETRCLAKGYPNMRLTWNWQAYCSRRLNNTDEVIRP